MHAVLPFDLYQHHNNSMQSKQAAALHDFHSRLAEGYRSIKGQVKTQKSGSSKILQLGSICFATDQTPHTVASLAIILNF